jgi:hypothetical protein
MGHNSNKKVKNKKRQSNKFVDIYDFTYLAIDSLINLGNDIKISNKKSFPVYRKK